MLLEDMEHTETAILLDYIKGLGFKYSTIAGLTVAVADMTIPEAKKGHIKDS